MTLPASTNAISFQQIQTEFGGANPIGLNEYYQNGSYVADGIPVPTSGTISLAQFWSTGITTGGPFTIGNSGTNYDYILPSVATWLTLKVAGGGGGGGGGDGAFGSTGGGGAGIYAVVKLPKTIGTKTVRFYIGAGGGGAAAGSTASAAGSGGGGYTFNNNTLANGAGGRGGSPGPNGSSGGGGGGGGSSAVAYWDNNNGVVVPICCAGGGGGGSGTGQLGGTATGNFVPNFLESSYPFYSVNQALGTTGETGWGRDYPQSYIGGDYGGGGGGGGGYGKISDSYGRPGTISYYSEYDSKYGITNYYINSNESRGGAGHIGRAGYNASLTFNTIYWGYSANGQTSQIANPAAASTASGLGGFGLNNGGAVRYNGNAGGHTFRYTTSTTPVSVNTLTLP